MKRGIYFFHGLQWKLICSYALAILTATCCFVISTTVLSDLYYTCNVQPTEEQQASLHYMATFRANTINYLTHSPYPLKQQNLQAWLIQQVRTVSPAVPLSIASSREQLQFISIVNSEGYVLASIGPNAVRPGKMLRSYLSPDERKILADVLQGKFPQKQALFVEQDQTWFMVDALVGNQHMPMGALLFRIMPPTLVNRLIYNFTTDFTLLITQELLGIALSLPLFVCICVFLCLSMIRRLEVMFNIQEQRIAAEERNHLARDLHDCIKQQLYALGAQIHVANELYLQPYRMQTHLQDAILLLQNIQEEMNNLIQHLRPAALAKKGLKNAMQDYIQSWSRLCGIHTTFVCDLQNNKDTVPLEREQEEALFRLLQEALSNVARHSCAWHAGVHLSRNSQETVLSIIDNGHGFDHEHVEPGVGLQSMQERLHALGGAVEITSTPEQGTSIVASLKHTGTLP